EGLERPVELGVSRRPGPPVQVRRREAVRGLEPPRLQRLEMTREEHRLVTREPGPVGRSDAVSEPACGLLQVTGVLVDRPRGPLPDGERGAGRPPTRGPGP